MSARKGKGVEAAEMRTDTGALGRGLAIIRVLAEAARPLTLHETAEAVGLTDSTAHRLLQTLYDANYVLRDPSGKRYFASSQAMCPLTMYHPLQTLRRDAFEPLRALRMRSELTSSLVVFVGNERLVVDISGAFGVLTPYYETCLRNPLHVAVSGKLLLMSRSRQEREALLGKGPYEAVTPQTITDPSAFEEELSMSQARGYFTNLDENFIGFSAIGAAVRCGPNQMLGCMMLAGASREFKPETMELWGKSLQEQAKLISFSPGARMTYAMFSS